MDRIIKNTYGKVTVRFHASHYFKVWEARKQNNLNTFKKEPIKDHPFLGKSVKYKNSSEVGYIEWVGRYWQDGGFFNQCLINYNGSHSFFIVDGENHPDKLYRKWTNDNKNLYTISEKSHPDYKYRFDFD